MSNTLTAQSGQSSHSPAYVKSLIHEYLASPKVQEQLALNAGYDKGFFLRTPNYSLKVKGFVQGLGLFYEDDTVVSNSWRVRQTRLQIHGYFYQHWHARLDMALHTGGGNLLANTYIEYTGWRYLRIRVGQFKAPFSLEVLEPARDLPAIFRSPIVMSAASFGQRQGRREVGLMLYGFLGDYVGYMMALTNGNGPAVQDDNDDFHYFGVLRFYPWRTDHKRSYIHLGFMAGREGPRPEGADLATPWNLEVFDAQERNGRSVSEAQDGVVVVTDPDTTCGWMYGVAVGFRHYRHESPIRTGGEFIYKQMARDRVTLILPGQGTIQRRASHIHLWGFWLQGGYFWQIGDDRHAGLEPLVRISYADVDDGSSDYPASLDTHGIGHALDIHGQRMWTYTLGFKAYFNQHVRLEFNWIMVQLEHTECIGPADGTATITDKINHSGGLMHAFVVQVTAKW